MLGIYDGEEEGSWGSGVVEQSERLLQQRSLQARPLRLHQQVPALHPPRHHQPRPHTNLFHSQEVVPRLREKAVAVGWSHPTPQRTAQVVLVGDCLLRAAPEERPWSSLPFLEAQRAQHEELSAAEVVELHDALWEFEARLPEPFLLHLPDQVADHPFRLLALPDAHQPESVRAYFEDVGECELGAAQGVPDPQGAVEAAGVSAEVVDAQLQVLVVARARPRHHRVAVRPPESELVAPVALLALEHAHPPLAVPRPAHVRQPQQRMVVSSVLRNAQEAGLAKGLHPRLAGGVNREEEVVQPHLPSPQIHCENLVLGGEEDDCFVVCGGGEGIDEFVEVVREDEFAVGVVVGECVLAVLGLVQDEEAALEDGHALVHHHERFGEGVLLGLRKHASARSARSAFLPFFIEAARRKLIKYHCSASFWWRRWGTRRTELSLEKATPFASFFSGSSTAITSCSSSCSVRGCGRSACRAMSTRARCFSTARGSRISTSPSGLSWLYAASGRSDCRLKSTAGTCFSGLVGLSTRRSPSLGSPSRSISMSGRPSALRQSMLGRWSSMGLGLRSRLSPGECPSGFVMGSMSVFSSWRAMSTLGTCLSTAVYATSYSAGSGECFWRWRYCWKRAKLSRQVWY